MNNSNYILIADDNQDMHYLIKRMLKDRNYRFIDTYDGKETLDKIDEIKPDIILLDLRMPKMDGLLVLEEIEKKGLLNEIPVLVLTVISDMELKIKALEMGASDFITKPPNPFELKARIDTYLKLKNITKQLKSYSQKLEKEVDKRTRELKRYVDKLESMVEEKVGVIKEKNEELRHSIRSAGSVQRSLLPTTFPLSDYVKFTAKHIPCEDVGGDFYDVFRIDENNIGLFIADVSGHGVPSAMITIFLKQEISYRVKRVVKDGQYVITKPSSILNDINKSFINSNIGEGFFYITMVYAIYNIKEKLLTCSIAGHHALPIIKKSNGKTDIINAESYPIGWFEGDLNYQDQDYKLDIGDILLLYTDGVFDLLFDNYKNIDLNKRLSMIEELLKKNDLMRRINREARRYIEKNGKLKDDVSILIMKVLK